MASRKVDKEKQYTALEALALIQGDESSEGDEAAEVDVLDSSSDDELLTSSNYTGNIDTEQEYISPEISEEEYEPPGKIRSTSQMGTSSETSSHGSPSRKTSQPTPDMPESPMQDSATPVRPQKAAVKSQTTTAQVENHWRNRDEEDTPYPYHFRPTREPGPVLDTTAPWSVLELFQLFLSITSVNTIIKNTNLNADKRIQEGKKYKWTPLTLKEFSNFLSIVIYSGLCELHKLSDYWRKGFPYNHPFPGNVMSRGRFEAILWSLHLSNPADDEENDRKKNTPEYDVLCKIKPLYTDIQTACRSYFHPDKLISIDERTVPSKAQHHMKQHHKAKPTKRGYKLYALADSATAYTWNFFIYEGKNPPHTDQGLSYTSVIDSMPFHLLGSGYTLDVDNLYTSPGLSENADGGDTRWIRNDQLLFIKRMDKTKMNVGRKVKRQGVRQMNIPVPDATGECNKNMEGVDVSDARIGYYTVHHKTMKWYKTFFYHFLDMAVVNCHILHKELCKKKPDLQPLTHKNFRETLVKELVEFGRGGVPETPVAPKVPTCMPEYIGVDASQSRKYCRRCFNAGDKRIKTPVQCRKCLVALCFTTARNCFKDWHDEN